MLGATGARFQGPPGSQVHRNVWTPDQLGRSVEFHTNGEVIDSVFNPGGYNTSPADSSFLSISPLELVSKNFHSGTVSFSQIKTEPCQVSEITTSNSFAHSAIGTVVKLEQASPKQRAMENMSNSVQNGGAIPVGIAVARQRLQEHAQHQPKELNRFNIQTDFGGATSAFSQNMFLTGTNSTMIPFPSDAVTMGLSNVQNAVRTPPSLWQYPTPLPMESMLPVPMPPVGFQLVRDPSTGQLIFLPTATSVEPFQQTVVWPSYSPQTLQAPHHLLMPPLTQQMQPPPLTPLQMLGSDYMGSTTLHQHTQTHSTRLVALTGDGKRKSSLPNIPMPMQPTTLIKIEDCTNSSTGAATNSSLQQSTIYEPCKSNSLAATITSAVHTNDTATDMSSHQLYYHSDGNLIQIATPHMHNTSAILQPNLETRSCLSPLPVSRCLSPPDNIQPEDTMTIAVPEVHDATIQTDTPVMSDDDNTNGPDECAYTINQVDDMPISASSNSYSELCQNNSSISEEIDSTANQSDEQSNRETSFESVSDLSTAEVPPIVTIEPLPVDDHQDKNHYPLMENDAPNQAKYVTITDIIAEAQPTTSSTSTPDISGLELLSNSIEAFEKNIFIKQEPQDKAENQHIPDIPRSDNESVDCSNQAKTYNSAEGHLGGLNLLCALAEQRFQEEVGQRSRKRSSSSDESDSKKMKKLHKEKHSSKKSSKKSKHSKDRKERKSKHHQSEEMDDEMIKQGLSETFNRVKATYPKCACKTDGGKDGGCCREKCNWPTAEEVYIAMNSDMRFRLAEMAKEVQEKKRKLNEMKTRERITQSDTDSRSYYCVENQSSKDSSTQSPNLSSLPINDNHTSIYPSSLADTQLLSHINTNATLNLKIDSSTAELPIDNQEVHSKKTKNLVGYIFASKKRLNDSKSENSSSATDETSLQSDSPLDFAPAIKKEIVDREDTNSEQSGLLSLAIDSQSQKSKHSSKHKKSKNKDRKRRRSLEIKERKRRIDAKCLLTGEYVDSLTTNSNTRVLTAMGGLFYAGSLSALQPPDIYTVTLDGERGNRPHIMSREEVLRDAIKEVAPTSVEEILPGARLCAYWSQQYRCLYPGTAALPTKPDLEPDSNFIIVEFDDGDSGRIAMEDIRFLFSDYPIVEYDPNPLLNLGKRKQRPSQSAIDIIHTDNATEITASPNIFRIEPLDSRLKDDIKESNKERRRLKKLRKDKLKLQLLNLELNRKHKHKHKCGDEFCKHRKHKKRRKHKKHHHRDTEEDIKEEEEDDEEEDNAVRATAIAAESSKSSLVTENEPLKDEVFDPDIQEETMTELEIASSNTESSGSCYQPPKNKEASVSAENNSKIAAFLPARQLWAWAGKGFKRGGAKGRGKKQFFKTIQRGKETIAVGDSAVFLSTGRPDRPYIGKIDSLWETSSNNRVVRVKWYYHPEETIGCPSLLYPGGLFQSPHADENDVQTISHKCKVLPHDIYTQKYGPDPSKYKSVYDNNDTFYLAGYYDPTSLTLKLEGNIPKSNEIESNSNSSSAESCPNT